MKEIKCKDNLYPFRLRKVGRVKKIFWDSMLTVEEFNSIIILAEKCHIKMMEDNYNAGWNE